MKEIKIEWNEADPDGIRPEDVLLKCLNRIKYLDELLPCYENKRVMRHLEMALLWEEKRNQKRKDQKVQGKMQPHIQVHGHDQEETDYENGLKLYDSAFLNEPDACNMKNDHVSGMGRIINDG